MENKMTREEFLKLLDKTDIFYACSKWVPVGHMVKIEVINYDNNIIEYQYSYIYLNKKDPDYSVSTDTYNIDELLHNAHIFETKESAMMYVFVND